MSNKETSLRLLGDPSGMQSSTYWNEWFNIVCKQDHSSFEWYCGSDEVARMLQYHFPTNKDENSSSSSITSSKHLRMIHPGSGTSLLPLDLCKTFPNSCHVVLDVSDIAIEEMKTIHDKHNTDHRNDDNDNNNNTSNPIRYELTDVLAPPLPFNDSSFDVWIDKGFVDAIFSSKQEDRDENQAQAKSLFEEAYRLLSSNLGVCIVVSLAEEHSLELVIQNWMGIGTGTTDNDKSKIKKWDHCIHFWELQPTSGAMLPVGIVMIKSDDTKPSAYVNSQERRRVAWHCIDGSENALLFSDDDNYECVLQKLTQQLESARASFFGRQQQSKQQKEKDDRRQVMATIEIKPSNSEVDILAVGQKIVSTTTWYLGSHADEEEAKQIQLTWYTPDDDKLSPHANNAHHDVPSLVKLVEIGYGISKVVIRCIVDSDDLEDLVESLLDSEHEADSAYEGIQSVDIDWDNTYPVSSSTNFSHRLE